MPFSILILLRILGFDGMVGQDSYAYVDFSKSIKQGILTSTHPGGFTWSQGYPLFGALFSFIGISVGTSLQLISSISLSCSLIIVYKIIKEIYPNTSDVNLLIYLVLFGVFSPYYLRNGMMTMSDTFACFLIISSIYYGYLYSTKHRIFHLYLFVAASSFSIFVRYPSALVVLPVAIYVLYKWIKEIRNLRHLIVVIILFGVYLLHTFFEKNPMDIFERNGAITHWDLFNFFSNTFHTDQGSFHYFVPNILYVFSPFAHYGFILIGFPLLYIIFKHKKFKHTYLFICVFSFLVYTLFMAGVNTQNPRHLLLLYPLVLVMCFYGFNYFFNLKAFKKNRILLVALGFIFQFLLCALAFKTIYIRNKLEQQIAKDLESYKNQTLYSFDIDVALKSRGNPLNIINLWEEEYQSFEKGALVLFNQERFKSQWKDENPMLNWDYLNQNYKLIEIEHFDNNWKLYLIE